MTKVEGPKPKETAKSQSQLVRAKLGSCTLTEGLVKLSAKTMTGDSTFTPTDHAMSPNPNLEITIEECSQNSEHLLENEGNDLENDSEQLFEIEGDDQENERDDTSDHLFEIEGNDHDNDRDDADVQLFTIEGNDTEENRDDTTIVDAPNDASQQKVYLPPVVGMEFESYDDAYNYYNCYAKELGFAIRVKSSWTKRNSKEKRGAVLCCNCEGFKTIKEANSRRKETRTGCQAMIRLRLVESNRWRVDEVKLEHNHLFDPERAQNSKSHKRMDVGVKRKLEPTLDVEVRTIKLYRTPVADAVGFGSSNLNEGETNNLTIITNQCKALQSAIAEVFPRAHHRICLSDIVQSILENMGGLQEYEAFQIVLFKTIYDSLKVDEFEMAWEDMIQCFGIRDHDWLRSLYEDRERWAPAYSKDTYFAGLSNFLRGESRSSFFYGYLDEQTSLKEFFDIYDLVLDKKRRQEALDDFESRDLSPILKTRCSYELQLSKLYTKNIFQKFQVEVVMMSSCFSITQVHTNGSIVTYMIKEREGEEIPRDVRNFEVMYDKAGADVRCICSCFNFKGYLCRHALCVLNYNGIEEIPYQYILSRWRKDFRRLYVPDLGSNNVDITNPVQWFDHLYRRGMQVVEEGMISQDHYMVAWQAFKESLNKVRLVADKHV
ncbi:hypothetical protein FEM48_Zijuj01G0308500 [Ziziphus jujuba var. spinosa]|uniref:Protein FAR1-RELATED SEQUENCE n=1 Tax=Ziziphus jujuba var. spinosa TaxID=714518 RepID=A0A978W639_ZIZJJ|nr:hypothetical protein FEM48_Zijuj01G0308500 [Ziziphus jujuba var. spinosa]